MLLAPPISPSGLDRGTLLQPLMELRESETSSYTKFDTKI